MKSSFVANYYMKTILRILLLIAAIWCTTVGQAQGHSYIITSTEPSVTEGGALTFQVAVQDGALGVRDGDIVEVHYTVISESATSGDDFNPVSGTLTFNSGSPGPLTFSVITNDDSTVEGSETVRVDFTVTCIDGSTACTASGPATPIYVTIIDNDQYAIASFVDVSVLKMSRAAMPS